MSGAPTLFWARAWNAALGIPADLEWHELEPVPESNTGFSETCQYLIRSPAGSGWRLFIDDEPLDVSQVDSSYWLWQPGFYAGEVTAELARDGESSRHVWLLDVSPDGRKLGRETFRSMVDEIWTWDPALVGGTEPASRLVGHGGEITSPWLELSRLRRHGPYFLGALRQLSARPRRTLVARRALASLQRARRVDIHSVLSALKSPNTAAALAGDFDEIESASFSDRIDVPDLHETLDSPANRAILTLARALLNRCRALRTRLQDEVAREPESSTRTLLARRWPARLEFLDGLERNLAIALRREPLSAPKRPEISAAGLTAIAADPCYARAWRFGWLALRPGVDGPATDDRLWISPSWEIFERWCFVRICAALRTSEAGLQWRRSEDGYCWEGNRNELIIAVELQSTFNAGPDYAQGRWSLSRQRKPDIVITIDDTSGKRFRVFDAKYRSSRENVLDAMESAHVYKDSLRIGDRRPECAFLLIPAGGGAPWLEDPNFHRDHGVGVRVLLPGEDPELPGFLLGCLR